MDIGSIFLILSLALVTFLIISRPVLQRQAETTPLVRRQAARQEDHQRSTLLAERDRILNALQELENDRLLGKVAEEDYTPQRAALLASGAAILKWLDESGSGDRSRPAPVPAPTGDDAVEQLVAARKRSRAEKSGGFCPKCGKTVQISDQFCSRCGAVLK